MRKPIVCRILIPQISGGYCEWNELSSAEQDRISERMVQRMGESLNGCFNSNNEMFEGLSR